MLLSLDEPASTNNFNLRSEDIWANGKLVFLQNLFYLKIIKINSYNLQK